MLQTQGAAAAARLCGCFLQSDIPVTYLAKCSVRGVTLQLNVVRVNKTFCVTSRQFCAFGRFLTKVEVFCLCSGQSRGYLCHADANQK
jgi:hypothetical protein